MKVYDVCMCDGMGVIFGMYAVGGKLRGLLLGRMHCAVVGYEDVSSGCGAEAAAVYTTTPGMLVPRSMLPLSGIIQCLIVDQWTKKISRLFVLERLPSEFAMQYS